MGFKSIDYSRLAAVLVEASKEQRHTIQAQQSRIDRQQAQIDALSAAMARQQAAPK
jgi:hypothetical protein